MAQELNNTWVNDSKSSAAVYHEDIQKAWAVANDLKPAVESGVLTVSRLVDITEAIANMGGNN